MGPALGRADLARAIAAIPEADVGRLAALFGFAAAAIEISSSVQPGFDSLPGEPEIGEGTNALAEPASPSVPLRPVPFWQLEAVEHFEPNALQPDLASPTALVPAGSVDSEAVLADVASPRDPRLREWPRLWPDLHRAIADRMPGRRLDVEGVVRALGKGCVVRRVPRRSRRAWPRRLLLLKDRHPRLVGFWWDQHEVERRLRALCGNESVTTLCLDPGAGEVGECLGRISAGAVADMPVLALGDLGHYGGASERLAWLRHGRRLRAGGARLHALLPVPRSRWTGEVTGTWGAAAWERDAGAARGGDSAPDAAERQRRVERLLSLVSPAIRIEPGLLRSVRRLLPSSAADVGTEADLYLYDAVVSGHPMGCELDPTRARALQAQRAEEPPDLIRRVDALIRAWHRNLPRSIWHAEVGALAAYPGSRRWLEGDVANSVAYFQEMADLLDTHRHEGSPAAEAKRAFFTRIEGRFRQQTWADERYCKHLARVWARVHPRFRAEDIPPGIEHEVLDAFADRRAPEGTLEIRQVGAETAAVPRTGIWPVVSATGSPLAMLRTRLPAEGVPIRRIGALPGGSTRTLDAITEKGRYTFSRIHRPEWASAMGRDRFGLWVEIDVRGATARLRWIPPGRFEMGSPESEAGRWDDEGPLHTVTLTHGFWLGETPVTQLLWEAVMSTNPSRFVSRDRPVDNVSWDDCQEFLRALGRHDDVWGLDARLPTEAEWEYACRAGTTAATYAGDLEIRGQNDAPLLDPVAWYGGNSGLEFELANGSDSSDWPNKQHSHTTAGSHPVGRKEPNPWGLYDMLGNVWEWCADWLGPYDPGPATDPTGPTKGSGRVVRGGSWFSHALYVRAAHRAWYPPVDRYDFVGFRLARGPGAQGRGTGQSPQPAGTGGRPSSRASGRAGAGRDERAARPARRKRGT